jgi:hypothetical protein
MRPLKDQSLHQLSPTQIQVIVQIVRDASGNRLIRPAFTEIMLELFDDIAGFETLPASKRRKYIDLLWLRYQIATDKK